LSHNLPHKLAHIYRTTTAQNAQVGRHGGAFGTQNLCVRCAVVCALVCPVAEGFVGQSLDAARGLAEKRRGLAGRAPDSS